MLLRDKFMKTLGAALCDVDLFGCWVCNGGIYAVGDRLMSNNF